MLTRLLRGDTEANNRLVLPSGHLTVNTDDYSLRIHDGVTPGGFEIKTKSVNDWGPGGKVIIGGNSQSGFLGEVSAYELVDGLTLASMVGLSAGTDINSSGPWLKFVHKGKILFVAKKPLKYGISWNELYNNGLVYGVDGPGDFPPDLSNPVNQNTIVTIGEYAFKVRLLTGLEEHDSTTPGGEWNDLIYPIHVDDPLKRGWYDYGNTDLMIGNPSAQGRRTWVQEHQGATAYTRGASNLTTLDLYNRGNNTLYYGWRPVLELVREE